MNKKITLAIVLALVAGGSFFGGMKFTGTKNTDVNRMRPDFNTNATGRRMQGNGPTSVRGEIISFDNTTLVIKTRDGGSKIVTVPNSVMITKTVASTTQDFLADTSVLVMGKTNPDGSVTADSIVISPPNFPRLPDSERRPDSAR